MIEDKILETVEREKLYVDRMQYKKDETSLYYLSAARKNILNWYPFRPDARLLEVDAACGAITGMLCEKVAEVVSCESTEERAEITRIRHANKRNLTVLAGMFGNVPIQGTFDYIIINDIFFRAQDFVDGENPKQQLFEMVCSLLKPDGRILLATENSLGARYLTGAPEKNNGVFSKAEWEHFLSEYATFQWRFYYPYPDHLFPNEIYTDETIRTMGFGRAYYNFLNKRFWFGDESRLLHSLCNENVAEHFANSFLIEIAKTTPDAQIHYVKLSGDRAPQFRIGTKIVNDGQEKWVYKYALDEQAEAHIEQLHTHECEDDNPQIHCLLSEKTPDGLKYPFLKEDTLDVKIVRALLEKDASAIRTMLDDAFAAYFKDCVETEYCDDEFRRIFGEARTKELMECIKPANIDLICDNIFCNGTQYDVIDCEWVLDLYVPKKFIIWRNLNELYGKHGELEHLISKAELCDIYDIDGEQERVFEEWNRFFTMKYVKANQMEQYVKPPVQIMLGNISECIGKNSLLSSTLYLDYGEGYSEEHKICSEIRVVQGKFAVEYHIPNVDKVRNIRWDPLEGRGCACRLREKQSGQKAYAINASLRENNYDIFFNTDPQYAIGLDGLENGTLLLSGELREIMPQEQMEYESCRDRKLERKDAYIQVLEDKSREFMAQAAERQKELEQENRQLGNQLALIENSRGYKLLLLLRRIKRKIWR